MGRSSGATVELTEIPGVTAHVRAIWLDNRGAAWVGTYGGGLARLAGGRADRLTTEQGLPENVVSCILPDDIGFVWLAGNRGITRVSLEELEAVADGRAGRLHPVVFGVGSGLVSSEINGGWQPSSWRSRDGRMWFATIAGIAVLDPARILRNPVAPPVVIEDVFAGGARLAKGAPTTVPAGSRNIEVRFAGLALARPEAVSYRYMLEGFDPEWVEAGDRRFALYASLPPGRFLFRVTAANEDGVWNRTGATISIKVLPRIYETGAFKALAGLAVLSLVVGAHKLRVLGLERRRRQLARLVDERTGQLTKAISIVRSINSRIGFDDLLAAILDEARAVHGTERGAFLVIDRATLRYEVRATLGMAGTAAEDLRLESEDAARELLTAGVELGPSIRLIRPGGPDTLSDRLYAAWGQPKALLVVTLEVSDHPEGLLVLASSRSPEAFDESDIDLLGRLLEHVRSAFLKARLLADLEEVSGKKSEALRIAAHDLRSPLASLISHMRLVSDRLRSGRFGPAEASSRLDRVGTLAEDTLCMLERVLDLSVIEAGKLPMTQVPTELPRLLEDCVAGHQQRAEEKGISLSLVGSPDVPALHGDPVRIRQVLDNLVGNALKYTHSGGRVTVGCVRRETDVVVNVSDTGQGLGPEDLRQVFRSFKRLSATPTGGESSTGLGLAIAKGIVEAHGGRIWVASQRGVGSTFSFSLPIRPEGAASLEH